MINATHLLKALTQSLSISAYGKKTSVLLATHVVYSYHYIFITLYYLYSYSTLFNAEDKEPGEFYSVALNLVKEVLDGCEDAHTYEDRLRDMFGIYAYPWFTMDRIVIMMVKQLHSITIGDELSCRLTEEFRSYFRPCGSGSGGTGSRTRNDSERMAYSYGEAKFMPV